MNNKPDNPKAVSSVALFTADVWEHVCPVVRIAHPLQRAGINVLRGASWVGGYLDCNVQQIEQSDFVIIQRNFPYHHAEFQSVLTEARRQRKKVIYDIDDLLFALPIDHPDYQFYRRTRAALINAIVQVDLVTCSTKQLAEQVSRFNLNVRVIPNYLDDDLWHLDEQLSDLMVKKERIKSITDIERPLVIGYCGSRSHQLDIESISPVLKQLLDQYKGKVEMKFWGVAPPPLLFYHSHVVYDRTLFVEYERFVDYFRAQQVDIFIAPLIHNEFNDCKSHLKFLEYSALGVPGVYSNEKPYQSVVRHTENGFLATTLADWEDYLRQLIEDPILRRKLGFNAWQTIANNWRLSTHAENWTICYKDAQFLSESSDTMQRVRSVASQSLQWHDELEQEIVAIQQPVIETKQLVQALQRQVIEQEQEIQHLRSYAAMVEGSLGWRVVQAITPLRYQLIPHGSLREQAIQQVIVTSQTARNEGIRSAYAKFRAALASYRRFGQFYEPETVAEEITVSTGNLCPSPAITVLYLEYGRQKVSKEQVQQWIETQTWKDVDLAAWSPETEPANWVDFVKGRYICVASVDLLNQPATYLEVNLMALESQKLAFTLNVNQKPELMLTMLRLRRLPGAASCPLLRTLARKECVTQDFQIDLDAWEFIRSAEQLPTLAAKILVHTTNLVDEVSDLAFEGMILGTEFSIERNSLFVHPSVYDQTVPESLAKAYCFAVDSVLKPDKLSRTKPTVMVIMPALAVGGAERVHQYLLEQLHNDINFVIVLLEPHDWSTGTTTDQFRQLTPYIYNLLDYLHPSLRFSGLRYLIGHYQPDTLYIANGCQWIFDNLVRIKELYPHLFVAAQVYDHQAGWINQYVPEVVAAIDSHIGTNRQICDAYAKRGAATSKIYLIEHCVDVNEYSPERFTVQARQRIRQQLGIAETQRVVTFMARLHPQKRPMDFVELARRFAADMSIVFLLIGDGPLKSPVDQEIARIDIRNIIHRTFYRPSSEVFSISDVYVLPSEYEGMPLVILEAQAMGIPVVVTDVGNNREVIQITGGGVVVNNVGDISGLYQGVQKMLQSPPNPLLIRQAVRNQLSQEFGILPEQMAIKYQKALFPKPN